MCSSLFRLLEGGYHSAPQRVAKRTERDDRNIGDAVGERVAAGDSDDAKSGSGKSNADVECPEIRRCCDTRTRSGGTAYGERLQCWGDCAESRTEKQRGGRMSAASAAAVVVAMAKTMP